MEIGAAKEDQVSARGWRRSQRRTIEASRVFSESKLIPFAKSTSARWIDLSRSPRRVASRLSPANAHRHASCWANECCLPSMSAGKDDRKPGGGTRTDGSVAPAAGELAGSFAGSCGAAGSSPLATRQPDTASRSCQSHRRRLASKLCTFEPVPLTVRRTRLRRCYLGRGCGRC